MVNIGNAKISVCRLLYTNTQVLFCILGNISIMRINSGHIVIPFFISLAIVEGRLDSWKSVVPWRTEYKQNSIEDRFQTNFNRVNFIPTVAESRQGVVETLEVLTNTPLGQVLTQFGLVSQQLAYSVNTKQGFFCLTLYIRLTFIGHAFS